MIATAPALSAHKRKRGLMLIMVLWVVTILSLLMYSLLYTLTLETVLTSTRKKGMQAEAIARAGLAKGFADLKNDMIVDFNNEDEPPFDGEADFWSNPEEGKTEIEFGDGEYTVEIIDENRYINLNTIGAANIILLEKIIEEIGMDEDDAKIIAAAIVDYGDSNTDSLLPDGSGGEEGLDWGIYVAEELGLNAREDDVEEIIFPNEPYITVDSLLDVYGVTPELFFGPESPEAEHYRKVSGLENKLPEGAFELEDQRRSRLDTEEPKGLRDYFSVDYSGTLNMNTAEQHVLTALFLAAGRTDGERAAEDVIKDRRGGRTRRFNSDNMFKSTEDLAENGTIGSVLSAIQAIQPIGVNSDTFNVRSTGTVRGTRKELEVMVVREIMILQRDEDFDIQDQAEDYFDLIEENDKWKDDDNELLSRIPAVFIKRWKKI